MTIQCRNANSRRFDTRKLRMKALDCQIVKSTTNGPSGVSDPIPERLLDIDWSINHQSIGLAFRESKDCPGDDRVDATTLSVDDDLNRIRMFFSLPACFLDRGRWSLSQRTSLNGWEHLFDQPIKNLQDINATHSRKLTPESLCTQREATEVHR